MASHCLRDSLPARPQGCETRSMFWKVYHLLLLSWVRDRPICKLDELMSFEVPQGLTVLLLRLQLRVAPRRSFARSVSLIVSLPLFVSLHACRHRSSIPCGSRNIAWHHFGVFFARGRHPLTASFDSTIYTNDWPLAKPCSRGRPGKT